MHESVIAVALAATIPALTFSLVASPVTAAQRN